jgi:PhzF family phenazine biosynthesis protein
MIDDKYITIFQVDAFTDRPFKGNPAAVCITDKPLSDKVMQKIAMEMNLSETTFAMPAHKSGIINSDRFAIRWFTPACEMSLCGHGTLATAKVLYDIFENKSESLIFHDKSGEVQVTRHGQYFQLNLPAANPEPIPLSEYIAAALRLENDGLTDSFMDAAMSENPRLLMLRFKDEAAVKAITPDNYELCQIQESLDYKEIIVTAPGEDDFDFVSRSFSPYLGVDEDPVSGEAHTLLAPYWGALLDKKNLIAYQASKRGGEIIMELRDDPKGFRDRVLLSGKAIIVMEAIIKIGLNHYQYY